MERGTVHAMGPNGPVPPVPDQNWAQGFIAPPQWCFAVEFIYGLSLVFIVPISYVLVI